MLLEATTCVAFVTAAVMNHTDGECRPDHCATLCWCWGLPTLFWEGNFLPNPPDRTVLRGGPLWGGEKLGARDRPFILNSSKLRGSPTHTGT